MLVSVSLRKSFCTLSHRKSVKSSLDASLQIVESSLCFPVTLQFVATRLFEVSLSLVVTVSSFEFAEVSSKASLEITLMFSAGIHKALSVRESSGACKCLRVCHLCVCL